MKVLDYKIIHFFLGFKRIHICFIQPRMHSYFHRYGRDGVLALAEALYFGLPVVVTDVGSARELIDESGFGILIPAAAEVGDIYYGNVASIILGANGEHESLCKNLTNAMIEMTERRYTRQDRERNAGGN